MWEIKKEFSAAVDACKPLNTFHVLNKMYFSFLRNKFSETKVISFSTKKQVLNRFGRRLFQRRPWPWRLLNTIWDLNTKFQQFCQTCLPRKAVSQKNRDWRKADRILIHRKYRVTSEYHKYSLELPNIIRSWLCYVISNQHVVSEETQKQTPKIKAAIVSACVTQGQCRDSWFWRRQYKWRANWASKYHCCLRSF